MAILVQDSMKLGARFNGLGAKFNGYRAQYIRMCMADAWRMCDPDAYVRVGLHVTNIRADTLLMLL